MKQAQLLIAQSHIKEGNPSAAIDIYNSIMDILSPDNRSLAEIKLAEPAAGGRAVCGSRGTVWECGG